MTLKSRIVPLVAAALFLASLALPFWTAQMHAPTYPEGALNMHMYTYRYGGDIDEWGVVGRLVGVRVPPPIPGVFFVLFPAAVVGIGLLALASMLRRRGPLLTAAALLPWAVMGIVMVWGQISLYQFGHDLDPDRPLRLLQPFTPPIVGIVTMGKIRTFHFPNVGSVLFVAGALLLVGRAWALGSLPMVRLPLPRRRAAVREVA